MSRQIIDTTTINTLLKQRGIKIPQPKICCGRTTPATPVRYARYLKLLGYHGDFAIRYNGVVVELGHLD